MGYTLEELIPDQLVGRERSHALGAVEDLQLVISFVHADAFADQSSAHEDAVAAEGDLAAGADLARDVLRLVVGLGERGRSFAFRRTPAFDGRSIAQRLVGTQRVVDAAPAFDVGIEVRAVVASG